MRHGKFMEGCLSCMLSCVAAISVLTYCPFQVAALEAHKLSVVQLAFSHDDRYLISVSRDRCLGLFERTADGSIDPSWFGVES